MVYLIGMWKINRRSGPLSSNIIEIIGSFAPLTLESPII